MTTSEHGLSDRWQAALLFAFGVSTSGLIVSMSGLGARPFDLFLLCASLGALVTAGLWLWILAARRSLGWGLVFSAAILIPYVNFVVASVFARRYWSEGARKPALLGLVALVVQMIAGLRVFSPGFTPPV